jgi:methionyl aminopeptidase
MRPGMIFTIGNFFFSAQPPEPVVCEKSPNYSLWDDGWTMSSVDGGLSAQFENTVLVTEQGVEVLTTD